MLSAASDGLQDWTHRLFNRARSSRSQTLTDNQTVRLSPPALQFDLFKLRGGLETAFHKL